MTETTSPILPRASGPGGATFVFILVMVAFDMLAFGIIAPVLPDLIRQFEGGDFGRASDLTGYLLLVWNAMQFLFSPILGAWSDRFGRRPIILLSCFGLGVDYIVMALAPTLRWLFIGRIISGITASEYFDCLRLCHRRYAAGKTRQAISARLLGLVSSLALQSAAISAIRTFVPP